MTITPSVGDSLLQPVMAARDTIAAHRNIIFFIVCPCLLFYFILFASHTILRLGNASKLSLLSLLRMGVSFVHFHRAQVRGGV